MPVSLYQGDCLTVLPTLPECSIDAVITDSPYHLTQLSRGGSLRVNDITTPFGRTRLGDRGFCNQKWDGGDIAFRSDTWAAMLPLIKPGGFLLSFGGTRTYHRMAVAIEDAGFEIIETLFWVYSTGFPKVGYIRDHDKEVVREGWAGSLKPAVEPIIMARRPLKGTIAQNMQTYDTGALNIDACRVPIDTEADKSQLRTMTRGLRADTSDQTWGLSSVEGAQVVQPSGRWPSNLLHDQSDEVMEVFAAFGDKKSGIPGIRRKDHETHSMAGRLAKTGDTEVGYADSGSTARFYRACPWSDDEHASRLFYSPKASKADRRGSRHPTLKPVALLRYLCRLVIPPNGVVLDPFAGSGTTGEAAALEGFDAILIEQESEYAEDIRERLALFLTDDIKVA